MYGEPPPSYKQSQFYPKADLNAKNSTKQNEFINEPLLKICDRSSSQEETNSHIYENIDEINNSNLVDRPQKRMSKQNAENVGRNSAVNKRAKFQALKKNSSAKGTKKTNEIITDSNNYSDFNNSLEISISPSTLSTSSSTTINKSNQKLKKQSYSTENGYNCILLT